MPAPLGLLTAHPPQLTMTLTNGANGTNGTSGANGHTDSVDPATLKRPNLALWVTKDHQWAANGNVATADSRIYQKEEAFPECPPDNCVIHVVSRRVGAS